MHKTILTIILVFVPFFCHAFQARVVGISDGDTIRVITDDKILIKIRLYGIDCPEKTQAFGSQAKKFTSTFAFGKTVEINTRDVDRYGRTVAIVSINSTCLNTELLKAGLAWVYRRYCDDQQWISFESEARSLHKGLWIENTPTAPWNFRRIRMSRQHER